VTELLENCDRVPASGAPVELLRPTLLRNGRRPIDDHVASEP
jgi:hypothetical protein